MVKKSDLKNKKAASVKKVLKKEADSVDQVKGEDVAADGEPEVRPSEDSVIDDLKTQVLDLEKEVALHKDNALRHLAELENFKRRKQQEVESIRKYAIEEFVTQFLPIIDGLDLAFQHSNTDASFEDFLKGFELVQKQLVDVLKKMGVVPIEALGQTFNPDFHQAMSQEKVEDQPSQTVIKEMQKGYLLYDKVIRPSLVVVSE